jgi:hypothetical protein
LVRLLIDTHILLWADEHPAESRSRCTRRCAM